MVPGIDPTSPHFWTVNTPLPQAVLVLQQALTKVPIVPNGRIFHTCFLTAHSYRPFFEAVSAHATAGLAVALHLALVALVLAHFLGALLGCPLAGSVRAPWPAGCNRARRGVWHVARHVVGRTARWIVHGLADCAQSTIVLHAHEQEVGGGQGAAIEKDVTQGGALWGRGRRGGNRDKGVVCHGMADDGGIDKGLEGGDAGIGVVDIGLQRGDIVVSRFDVEVINEGAARDEAMDAGFLYPKACS
jgi:hypothetical protein